ncbi:uncharacterized protein LOC128551944 [Mercenaria mercenaria]|uniref:uncharacterized protein LOC128551944 n=1 Tax=Mercenaria mercenaria TaxID=6596 RepID=UPI00234F620C|nr:uncharacterized protein LOC128551944 [Mercenaria mercenaria]
MDYPCIVCSSEVRPRQHAVACDKCAKWQHRTCNTGITAAAYRQAVRQGDDIPSICKMCVSQSPQLSVSDESENELEPTILERSVRQVSSVNIFRSAQTIAEQILRENVGPDNAVIPKKKLLKRVANRTRATHRPEEPKTLDFEVNLEYLQCDDFLVDDITFEGQRHFVFSTPYQLELLRNGVEIKGCAFHWSQAVWRRVVDVGLAETYQRWHHRLNSKAGNMGLQFYRLVPLLQTEADDVKMAIRAGDLGRNMEGRSKTLEKSLSSIWDQYEEGNITTSKFLKRCGELYGVRV